MKSLTDAVIDAALNQVADNGDSLTVCSAAPTTFAEAQTTYMLAAVTLTKGAGNGDYTVANGDTSGRKLTVAAQNNVPVTNSGTATHIAICDTVNSVLLLVTECSGPALTSGSEANIPAFDYESGDPV